MKNKNIFWGLALILLAVFIILDAFGYFAHIGIIKIIFTAILATLSIKGIFKVNFPLAIFPIAFLGILYSNELNIANLTPWPILFIALLFSIGLSLIFHKPNYHYHHHNHSEYNKVINEEDTSNVNCSVTFGSLVKYINTNDFTTANIECTFGSATVYFDNALIQGNSASINLEVSFSSLELYIPKNWNIVKATDCTFSGVEEKNNQNNEKGPTVNLYGDVTFSGLTIYYI